MAERHQVIIVGGGPVGMGMAVDLGLRGVDCVVVERHKEPQQIPKGQHLTPRTLEHFYFWGIIEQLRAARIMPKGYPIGSRVTAYGNMMSKYWYTPARDEVLRPYHYESGERVPQYRAETVLRKRVAELPNVATRFGWTVEQIKQDGDQVRVTISETEMAVQMRSRYEWAGFVDADDPAKNTVSGTAQVLEADYVVGCDGARSIVRDQVGISRRGTDFNQKMMLAVFRSKDLHQALNRFPEGTTYRALHPDLEGYWMFFGRVDVGESWFFHAPVPMNTTSDNYDFQALLNRAAGFQFHAQFDHVGFWDLRVSVADKYQVGRVFIAGDAAHSHPPYGGYGLNTGLEDVANLGWKLTAKLEGWGSEALLESYSEERRPIFWETGEDFIVAGIENDRAFLERYSPDRDIGEFALAWKELEDEGNRRSLTYEPHFEGSSVVFGPPGGLCSAHGSYSFFARPGHHLPPQPLSNGRYLPAELGTGFTLLALEADEKDIRSIRLAATSLHVPFKIVRDTYAAGRDQYGSRLVLIRPDQYVVWVGNSAPLDTAGLIRKVIGAT